jgi:hypothetical protein
MFAAMYDAVADGVNVAKPADAVYLRRFRTDPFKRRLERRPDIANRPSRPDRFAAAGLKREQSRAAYSFDEAFGKHSIGTAFDLLKARRY